MDDVRRNFYRNNILKFIPERDATILICGGGPLDKEIFEAAGYINVTISNLDTRMDGKQYVPFKWAYEDAESLSFAKDSYDYVAIHAAIHHASSPHRVLTEMYRVAKMGVLAIESSDSFVMRLLERFNLTQVYEHAAVYYNDGKFGGVNNTEIPNFVYRWTEREVEKTIKSYAPYAKHNFFYTYATTFPVTPEMEKNGLLKYLILKILQPLFWLLTRVFRKQQNLMAFFIEKPSYSNGIFPWILLDKSGKPTFNLQWGDQKYKKQTD